MTNKIGKYTGEFTSIDGDIIYSADVGDTFEAVQVPIGGIIAWHKTFVTADSGTTTSAAASKLIQSGQNFLTTVNPGNIVFNTTDSTWAYVTAVDSDTQLSISSDIMASSEAYTIYRTPRLPDAWVECNGQVLSDADSPFNGGTIPDMNGTTDATSRFIRGLKNAVTGTTGGSATQVFKWTSGSSTQQRPATTISGNIVTNVNGWASDGIASASSNSGDTYTQLQTVLPPYISLTWIMRIK